ncbi:nuclear transport factor 2 family protein [Kocuria sp. M1R5S2]|uniref:nuclear transport factor 2 family protein n=1 Tax=Kocuria rhizosphaerae TaxID=3376285 RepID=UPI00379B3647
MTSAETVIAAGTELFRDRDPSAVDRWWAEDFRQHSPLAPDGREGLRDLVQHLPEDFRVEIVRVLDDRDLVAVHAVYEGLGPGPVVGFDVFRVAGGRIAEHWDVMAPLRHGPRGTRPQVDGPVEVTDRERTRDNKTLAAEWVETALIGHEPGMVQDHVAFDGVEDHAAGGDRCLYRRLHRVVGEGNFVLTVCEGVAASDRGRTVACYDLWRLEDGRIAEHWAVVQPEPEEMAHGNGML